MSFLLGKFGTFLPCHNELWIVNASIVTVRCFVWICEKHLPPELYLEANRQTEQHYIIQLVHKITLPRHSLEEPVKHVLVHLAGPRAKQLHHLLRLRIVAVQRPELATGVPEQNQKVFRVRPCNLFQHLLLGVPVHHPWEHAVLDRVQDDAPVRLGRRLFIQFGA